MEILTQQGAGATHGAETERQAPDVAASLLAALAYADLFDYPLTIDELLKYQVGTGYGLAQIKACLADDTALGGLVVESSGYYALRGRDEVFGTRQERRVAAHKVWRRARIYARWIGRLPLVRMVAVTGALAVDNIAERPDIDLLVVARAGRVWLCRRTIIAVVRLARLFGDDLCPNYILADDSLDLQQRDFFTAHELAQMIPTSGRSIHSKMLAANPWAVTFLPLAFPPLRNDKSRDPRGVARRLAESVISARVFDGWERWELRRLQAKLRPYIGDVAEVICSPSQCKGHTGLHRQTVMTRYRESLRGLGIYARFSELLDEGSDAI